MNNLFNTTVRLGLYAIVAYIVFVIFYKQSHEDGFQTDFVRHAFLVLPILRGEFFVPHSMLHYLTFSVFKLFNWFGFHLTMLNTMILISTCLLILTIEVIYRVLNYFVIDGFGNFIKVLIAISLVFVASIYFPLFSHLIYLGQWSANTWHNPTTLLVKPIALCSMVGVYFLISKNPISEKIKFRIALSILFALGIWAKPSFAITFYPALALFMILYYGKDLKLLFTIFIVMFPAAILLVIQYVQTYYAELNSTTDLKDNIIFSPFAVIHYFSPNAFVSFLLATLFPIAVFIADYANAKKNRLLILVWFNLFSAYFFVSMFAEKIKFTQANFAFGYNLALFFLFIFSFIHFINFIKSKKDFRSQLISSLLMLIFFLHLFSGVYSYFRFLLLKDYS